MKVVVALLLSGLTAAAQPAPLSGFQDEGAFTAYLNEARLGIFKFSLTPDGTYRSTVTISMAGQSVEHKYEVTPDAEGRWKHVLMSIPMLGDMTADRDGVNFTSKVKEKTITGTLKPDSVLYIGNAPALAASIIRRYDAAKGGKQTVQLFIAPSTNMEGWVERRDTLARTVNGRDLQLTRYGMGFTG